MVGLTREQRAAKEAQKDEPMMVAKEVPKPAVVASPGCVRMERDGKTAEVREGKSVEMMRALGWKVA